MGYRILLIYPPAAESDQPQSVETGLGADRQFMPYGLLTTAAELRGGGFDVEVVNLATCSWPRAIAAVKSRPADLVGISCYTFHRHAAAALGAEIKAIFPQSHLTVGGPHVSAMPQPWLEHYPAFDSVVIGEGEATALELAQTLRDGGSPVGMAGTAYCDGGSVRTGPAREFIADLDRLGKPWKHFNYGFVITSRGCPGKCTFCSSPTLWGRKIRFRSAENVLDELEELVIRRGHRFLNVKDDTFTARKSRVAEICRGIEQRKLVFRWGCDTRVDCVDRELLAAMRRAGCVRLNLGIESASPEVLDNLGKPIDPDRALRVTADARALGMNVRYYLIMGTRGETPKAVHQTLSFIERARPTHFLLHAMSIYPGTKEFQLAEEAQLVSVEDYFDRSKLACCFLPLGEDSPEMEHVLKTVFQELGDGEQVHAPYTLEEREEILRRHPEMLRSHTDLAAAYARKWRLDEAEQVLEKAGATLGAELPELLHYAACVKYARRDFLAAEQFFDRAWKAAPDDTSIVWNRNTIHGVNRADYLRQGQVTMQLFDHLESTELLFLEDGEHQIVSVPP
jgi:radical SAM superfamily enzyme YgiQ (UPF0313 family)